MKKSVDENEIIKNECAAERAYWHEMASCFFKEDEFMKCKILKIPRVQLYEEIWTETFGRVALK